MDVDYFVFHFGALNASGIWRPGISKGHVIAIMALSNHWLAFAQG
jgi:hypothetical protein